MSSFPKAQQLKGLGRKHGKEQRPSLFKSLQESGELWKALTSRFSDPSLQGGEDCRPASGRGEWVKLLLKRSFDHLLAQMQVTIKGKYL
jgi:hypothetical protein